MNRLHVRAMLCGLALALVLTGCGDDDDTGPAAPPAYDLTGTWSIDETINAAGCGFGIQTDSYTMTVVQSGSSITVTTSDGEFTGTVSGTRVSWTGSYASDGGTVTIRSMSIQATDGGTAIEGSVQWDWTDGADSCSGATTVTGRKTS